MIKGENLAQIEKFEKWMIKAEVNYTLRIGPLLDKTVGSLG